MSNREFTTIVTRNAPLTPAGTGTLANYQPEVPVDFSSKNLDGVRFHLSVRSIVGSADAWRLKAKFQLGNWDEAGAGFSQIFWTDLDAAQVSKLILEGQDWAGGSPPAPVETNPFLHPQVLTTTGYSVVNTGGGTPASSVSSADGYKGKNSYRVTFGSASTDYGSGMAVTDGSGILITPNELGTFSWYVRASKRQRLRLAVDYYSSTGTLLGTNSGATTVVEANTVTRLTVTGTSPLNTTYVRMRVVNIAGADASLWTTGDWLAGSAPFYRPGIAPGNYFDGDTPDTATADFAWVGTAGSSASTRTVVAGSENNVVCRDSDLLPLRCSRSIKGFGRFVRMWLWLEATSPSADFAVILSITSD